MKPKKPIIYALILLFVVAFMIPQRKTDVASDPAMKVISSPKPSTLSNVTVVTLATDDSYVSNNSADDCFGNETRLRIGVSSQSDEKFQSYLRFSLEDEPNDWNAVFIRLDVEIAYEPFHIDVELINDTSWDEDNITWNVGKNLNSEGIIGSFFVDNDSVKPYYDINVSGYVSNSEEISIRLKTTYQNQTKFIPLYSKEDNESSCTRPSLIWQYEEKNSITVINPKKGDTVSMGYQDIEWKSTGVINYVSIDLYKNEKVVSHIATKTENNGEYLLWRLYYNDDYDGDGYQIKVMDHENESLYGMSGKFGISLKEETTGNPQLFIWIPIVVTIILSVVAIVVIYWMKRKGGRSSRSTLDFGSKGGKGDDIEIDF